jgi:hypothetical protein
MTLAQILIVAIITAVVSVASGLVLGEISEVIRVMIVVPLATLAAVLLAWPVARLFGVGPLMFLSGPCPNCGQRPTAWGVTEQGAKHIRLVCSNCDQSVELWYSKSIPDAPSGAIPRYRLRWPKFLGLWKRVTASVD